MPPQSAMPSWRAATAAGRVLEVSGQGEELLFVWAESAGGEHAEQGGSVQIKGAVALLR